MHANAKECQGTVWIRQSHGTTVTSVGRLFFPPKYISSIPGCCKLSFKNTLSIFPHRIEADVVLRELAVLQCQEVVDFLWNNNHGAKQSKQLERHDKEQHVVDDHGRLCCLQLPDPEPLGLGIHPPSHQQLFGRWNRTCQSPAAFLEGQTVSSNTAQPSHSHSWHRSVATAKSFSMDGSKTRCTLMLRQEQMQQTTCRGRARLFKVCYVCVCELSRNSANTFGLYSICPYCVSFWINVKL